MRRFVPLALGAFLLLSTATVTTAAPAAPAPSATSPDAAISAVSWASYLTHIEGFTDKFVDNLDQLSDALDYEDDVTAAKVFGAGKRLLAAEAKWLATHKPGNKCFKAVYARNTLYVKAYLSAYTYLGRWMAAYPYGTDADYDRGMAAMKTGTARLTQATALLNETDCGGGSSSS